MRSWLYLALMAPDGLIDGEVPHYQVRNRKRWKGEVVMKEPTGRKMQNKKKKKKK